MRLAVSAGIAEACFAADALPLFVPLLALLFAGAVAATRWISLGVLAGAVIPPIGVWLELGGLCALLCLFSSLVILLKHLGNIGRLLRRTEPRFEFKKDLSLKFEEEDF